MYDEFDEFDELTETIECRECGHEIHEESAICPNCGWAVTENNRPWSNKPSWLKWMGLIGIVGIIVALAWPVVQFLRLLMR